MFNKKVRLRGVMRKGGMAEVQTSVCVQNCIFLSMQEEEIKKEKSRNIH